MLAFTMLLLLMLKPDLFFSLAGLFSTLRAGLIKNRTHEPLSGELPTSPDRVDIWGSRTSPTLFASEIQLHGNADKTWALQHRRRNIVVDHHNSLVRIKQVLRKDADAAMGEGISHLHIRYP